MVSASHPPDPAERCGKLLKRDSGRVCSVFLDESNV